MKPLPVFLGYDQREAVGFHVCVQSILERSTIPVSIFPVSGDLRDGTNHFTYARFLVPHLCDYRGVALFADGSDMLFLDDLRRLFQEHDPYAAVQVVKREYRTRHARKYCGTSMEADNRDYRRKNWSSVMLFNCAHFANRVLTPDYVASNGGAHLHGFDWLPDDKLGELPKKWNVLVGEDGEEQASPSLVHYTLGIPAMPHYSRCRWSREWWETYDRARRVG